MNGWMRNRTVGGSDKGMKWKKMKRSEMKKVECLLLEVVEAEICLKGVSQGTL